MGKSNTSGTHRTHAIGTWKNLYGTGMRAPMGGRGCAQCAEGKWKEGRKREKARG